MDTTETDFPGPNDSKLLAAVADDNLEAVNRLCNEGGNPTAVDAAQGTSALHLALQQESRAAIAKRLLEQHGLNVNITDSNGRTPMHDALRHQRGTDKRELTERLLGCGGDINAKDKDGNAPFYELTQVDSFDGEIGLIDFLCSQGADLEQRNQEGHNILEDAATRADKLDDAKDPRGWLRLMRHLLTDIGLPISDDCCPTQCTPFKDWLSKKEGHLLSN